MEKTQIVADVEASPLSKTIQRKLDTLWGNTNEAKNFTIFRIPQILSQSKKNLFEPSVISIGPFHRGQKSLQTMEEQKWRFLKNFLSRGNHISLDLFISEMKLLEERTRRCYSETFDNLHSDTFVEMMLLDGCFVLEYFLKKYEGYSNAICEVGWNSYFIYNDLVLLENQIPFFIVEKLYDKIGFKQEDKMDFVKYIASKYLARTLSDYCIDKIPNPPAEIHHLVHLCYHYLVPNPEKPNVLSSKSFDLSRIFSTSKLIKGVPNSTENISSMVIPSATELKLKGLKFTPKSNPKHLLDISFEYGVLKIPKIVITDDTKPIFANLIAFEHSNYGKKDKPFTSFVAFLDHLVNTPNDVTILQECGIVENRLGIEDEVTHFINQVTEGTVFEGDHYLTELYTEVNRFSQSSWSRHRAKLIRDYFSNPLAIISLIAAFILLVLTLVQSFFAVFAYIRPPSS